MTHRPAVSSDPHRLSSVAPCQNKQIPSAVAHLITLSPLIRGAKIILSVTLWLLLVITVIHHPRPNNHIEPASYDRAQRATRAHPTGRMTVLDDGFEALLEPFYNGKKLTDPISTKEDKYQLLPAFLKVKGTAKKSWCIFARAINLV